MSWPKPTGVTPMIMILDYIGSRWHVNATTRLILLPLSGGELFDEGSYLNRVMKFSYKCFLYSEVALHNVMEPLSVQA